MNPNISIPPTAADAYRAMLAEQTYASLKEVALTEVKQVTLSIPFPGSNEKKVLAQAKEIGVKNGFTVLGGEYDRYDEAVYVTIKGDLSKLAKFVNKWMSSDDSDEEILNDYSESYDSSINEGKMVTLTVPFPGSNEDKIMAQAKTLGKTHGFTVLGGEYNRYDKTVDIELKGDLSKLAKFVNMWMRTDDSDEEILNDYSESYDSSIAEETEAPDYGFASNPPKVKLKQLKAVIKKIPDNKVDYIVHVLARLANFEQIKEIMKGMSVKSN